MQICAYAVREGVWNSGGIALLFLVSALGGVSFQLYDADLYPRHLHYRILDVLHSRSGRFGEGEEIICCLCTISLMSAYNPLAVPTTLSWHQLGVLLMLLPWSWSLFSNIVITGVGDCILVLRSTSVVRCKDIR
jgi:hypothetical protein